MHDVWKIGGGRGLRGGAGTILDWVFPERPQSFRYQRQPANDCSPGEWRETAKQGAGRFNVEMDRYRESLVWTTACSRMTERDGKDQG